MQKIKEYLKLNQPIVYETLKNSYKNHKTTHAYIINGAKGSPVLEIARFMAKSFICLNKDENNLACEECINCNKIENNGYADFKVINGIDLKTDTVLDIQDEFSKSSIEQEGIKIYIIDLIEKAPIQSLNKLLKFIEEPTSNIVAIFTSNSVSSILPTIVSRCQTINLKEFSLSELSSYLIKNDVSEEDAFLLSRISNNSELNLTIAKSEEYSVLKNIVKTSLEYLANVDDMYIIYMQNDGLKQLDQINYIDLYLDIIEVCLLEAIIKKESINHVSKFYDALITGIMESYKNIDKMIIEITNAKLALLSNANKQLVFDKLLINLLRK